MNCLELKNVSYSYGRGAEDALKNINVGFERGKVYAIVGQSGAGKSTLLSLISGLDLCAGGGIYFNGANIVGLDRDEYRARSVGVIFQSYNLLPNSTAVYNVTLSMDVGGVRMSGRAKKEFARGLLAKVGIDGETAGRKITRLSGGEQQRVAIARALSNGPDVIVADEPTGNLDAETEADVLKILARLAREEDKCVIIVTHSDGVAACADETLNMSGGKLSTIS